MMVSTSPGSLFFDDLPYLTQLHHLKGELDRVLAFIRLDIGEEPVAEDDNFPPNFWLINAVATQFGELSAEADFTRPHLVDAVRAARNTIEQTPYASAFRRICNDAAVHAWFIDPVEAYVSFTVRKPRVCFFVPDRTTVFPTGVFVVRDTRYSVDDQPDRQTRLSCGSGAVRYSEVYREGHRAHRVIFPGIPVSAVVYLA